MGHKKIHVKSARTHSLAWNVTLILALLLAALLGLSFFSGWGLAKNRQLTRQYISDTAELYVAQVNRDMEQINSEMIYMLEEDCVRQIPQKMTSKDGAYYEILGQVRGKLVRLKARYAETQNFFIYSQTADMLITDSGTAFSYSERTDLYLTVMNYLSDAAATDSVVASWRMLQADGQDYIFGWYARDKKACACIIEVNELYDIIQSAVSNYETVPFMIDNSDRFLTPSGATEEETEEIREAIGTDSVLSYALGSVGDLNLYIKPHQGVLQNILTFQIVFVALIVALILLAAWLVWRYFTNVMRPLNQFMMNLNDIDEEQMLHEDGANHILELESANSRFRELIRKIQSLKIAIYEKELKERQAELEYMQEQMRPHFLLNCLSLIHGIADAKGVVEITHITEELSDYMRHMFRESGQLRPVGEELRQVHAYVELQRVRYGSEAFSYDETLDGVGEEVPLPPLLLQPLVENAIVHAVSLDRHIEISVYIAAEELEDGKYLYLSVSDTGPGFSREALEALAEDKPIVYGGRRHIGLKNIRRRLELLYNGRASVTFMNMGEGYGAVAEIRIPLDA